jgi:hypothetical protein
MRDLSSQQTRQLIDCEQLFATYRAAQRELAERFDGSMAWKTVKGQDYLYRKRNGAWKSLGPRDERTDKTFAHFHDGRAALRDRRRALDEKIKQMAPVNKALRIGRVPSVSARLLRRLDGLGVLGQGLKIAGTHALYAYERMGGVQFGEEAISTQDIDLLYDARGSLKLVAGDVKEHGLLGILQSLDKSFQLTERNSFRAVNDEGFMVDLITPATRSPSLREFKARIGDRPDDLTAAEIEGLKWLESAPSVSQIVLDERGYPLTMVVADPRAFACHKLWIAQRDDRDPLKKRRDRKQAISLIEMLTTRIPSLRFDDPVLRAVPADVRALGQEIVEEVSARRASMEQADSDWDR